MVTETKRLLKREDIKTMRKDIKILKKGGFLKQEEENNIILQIEKELEIDKLKTAEKVIGVVDDKIKIPALEVKLKSKNESILPNVNLQEKITPITENKIEQNNISQPFINEEMPKEYLDLIAEVKNKDIKEENQYQNNNQNTTKLKDKYREKFDEKVKEPVPEALGFVQEKRKSFLEEVEDLVKKNKKYGKKFN